MRFQLNPKLLLLINAVGIALAVSALASLYQVGLIVHSSLYNYGLWFSYEWAVPYWIYERVVFALLVATVGGNAFSMAYVVLAEKAKERKPSPVQPRSSVTRQPKVVEKEKPREERKVQLFKPMEVTDDGVEIAALPMVCNKCGKVFTQPLCMFDFKSGKPRLVNVCPYCNAVLAVTGNAKG